jgi:hypothetical protein
VGKKSLKGKLFVEIPSKAGLKSWMLVSQIQE